MPEDLLKYEHEEQQDIIHKSKLFDKERFKGVSVHLMPLARNAFYTKIMKSSITDFDNSEMDGISVQN